MSNQHVLISGDLVTNLAGTTCIVTKFKDFDLKEVDVLFPGHGVAKGNASELKLHPWASLLRDFMKAASLAGRKPEEHQGLRDELKWLIEGALKGEV